MSQTVYTKCRICLSLCGLDVTVGDDGRVERIAPDKENPYTWRDFCAKGRTAHQLLEHPRRLLAPMKRVGERYVEVSYEEAVGDIAGGLNAILERHGPDAIGMYWGNPGGLGSMANSMFAAGLLDAIGTSNRYFVGSLDQNNFHVVAEAMYGSPLFSLQADVDDCRCFLMVGMNPAVSGMHWMEAVPNGWKRVLAAQAKGGNLIVVDPLRTPTTEKADLHVPVRPGQDWAFLLGVLKVILAEGWEDGPACAELTGLDAVRRLAANADLDDLAARCDVAVTVITDVARRFATAPAAMCLTHTGVSQNVTGTLGEWFGQLLNHLTGNVDRPGGRRYEPGAVDMVGLFAKLAPPLPGTSRVRGLPAVSGYHSLAELPGEITTPGPGQIRALLIHAGNPVVSGPDGGALDAALAQLELLVAIDLVQRESHRHAHWLIPARHWLERSEIHIVACSLQDQPYLHPGPAAVDAPPGVRDEWEFFTDLCLAMGVPLFGRRGVNSFIRATRWAAQRTGRPELAFHANWIERLLLRLGRKVTYRQVQDHPHGWVFGAKEFGHFRSALRTPDKRVQAAPPAFVARARLQLATPPTPTPGEYPFVLSNRRRHDAMNSWLNDLPGLHRHERENRLEIHPGDAAALGVDTGDRVEVSSSSGAIELCAVVSDATRPGVVVADHGWGSRVFDPKAGAAPTAYGVNRNLLVANDNLDPLSQTPALNSTHVQIRVVSPAARAALLQDNPSGATASQRP